MVILYLVCGTEKRRVLPFWLDVDMDLRHVRRVG